MKRIIGQWLCGEGTALYGSATILCLAILTIVMQLWRADLRLPLSYDGDALLSGMLVKSVAENGWYLHNPYLGAPNGLDYYDYPFGDLLHFACIKLLTPLCSQYALLLNVFFLLSFPLTTLSSLFVFRRFGFAAPGAIVGSLLYAFLPYHFLRGEYHLFLSMYYLVPPMVMVLLWVGGDCGCSRKQLPASVAICFLTALAGVYYAAFSCLLLLFAGAVKALRESRLTPLLLPGALAGVIVFGSVINILPSVLYWRTQGRNPQVGQRSPYESELYGLKFSQLVLPVTDHRVALLTGSKAEYSSAMPLVNENDDASLGIVGVCGFLVLLGCLLLPNRSALPTGLDRLANLNLFALLLGTIGGFGSLIALTVSPAIRCYNRLSIFIAFFALFAVVSCLDSWYRRSAFVGMKRLLGFTLPGVLLLIGIFDQTTAQDVPQYTDLKRQFQSDDRFVQQIEAMTPQAKIFQLPYVAFPESPPVHRMTDYQQLRGYLHAKSLRWSYGTIKGRPGDQWERKVVAQPFPQMVASLKAAGFGGLWIDCDGYADQGNDLKAAATKMLGVDPLISDDQHFLFFPLIPAAGKTPR